MSVKGFFKGVYWFLKTCFTKQVSSEKVRGIVFHELQQKDEITVHDVLDHFDDFAVNPDTLIRSNNYLSIAKLYVVLNDMEQEGLIKGELKYPHPQAERRRIHWSRA